MNNRGLFLIKPDAVARGLRNTIIDLIVAEGFDILFSKILRLDEALIRAYQPAMNEPSEFGEGWKHEVVAAQTSGLSEVLVVERAEALRTAQALKKRIRAEYAPGAHYHPRVIFNLLHSPDTEEEMDINWRALIPECASLFSESDASSSLLVGGNTLSSNPLVVLEGLPGAGKTSLLRMLSQTFCCVPECLPHFSGQATNQEDFIDHDFEKLWQGRAAGRAALIDRGYASTLSWNYARLIVDGELDYYDLLSYASKRLRHSQIRPDLYILIEVDPATSLSRKSRPVVKNDLWTQEEYLAASSRFYQSYFAVVEPQIPCWRICGNEGLEQISDKILSMFNQFPNDRSNLHSLS